MSEASWLVLRCSACKQCSGHRHQKGRCPHCGQALGRESELVRTALNASELHVEVAMANTPESLREDLRARMAKGGMPSGQAVPSRSSLLQRLRSGADEGGAITAQTVGRILHEMNVEEHVDSVMEQAELEGLVIRAGNGRWTFLE